MSIIFKAALNSQEVTAYESLYVDDFDIEVDGSMGQALVHGTSILKSTLKSTKLN